MKQFVFRNKGTLDVRSITTFGVSSKEGKNPIGFFGTGLKYAISVLLRNKCSISIYTGGKTYTFGTQTARVRVNDFEFITMNGVELGFTTELGKTWEPWQAFRELACNCMDENGTYYQVTDEVTCGQDETVVLVSGVPFEKAWAEQDSIILNSKPICNNEQIEICPGESQYIYYRGVRVMTLPLKSVYTYNFLEQMDLTEDRTLKNSYLPEYMLAREVSRRITNMDITTRCCDARDADGLRGSVPLCCSHLCGVRVGCHEARTILQEREFFGQDVRSGEETLHIH